MESRKVGSLSLLTRCLLERYTLVMLADQEIHHHGEPALALPL